jgi:hypothetical protein
MISRLYNPDILTAAVNEQAPDLLREDWNGTKWITNPNHIALTDGRNIGMFEAQEGVGVFFGHTIFRDRGKLALNAARKIIKALVDFFGAKIIHGETPIEKRAARWFSRQLGFKSQGVKSTPYGDVELFALECV